MTGQEELRIEQGELVMDSGLGTLSFTRPVAWQYTGKQKVPISVEWQLLASSQYRFEVGEYDASKPLFIDPLLQSTYLGGSQFEFVATHLFDGGKNLYLTGQTFSLDFPGTTEGLQENRGGGNTPPDPQTIDDNDIFITRLSSDLKQGSTVTPACDYTGQTKSIGDTNYPDDTEMTCAAAHLIANGRITTGLGTIVKWQVNTFAMATGSSIQGKGIFAIKVL